MKTSLPYRAWHAEIEAGEISELEPYTAQAANDAYRRKLDREAAARGVDSKQVAREYAAGYGIINDYAIARIVVS